MNAIGNALTTATPEALTLYRALLAALRQVGPFQEEAKKTSVHLTNKSAFLGVHFRRNYLILTVKSASPIDSPRIVKVEQVSKNRWHCDVKFAAAAEIDDVLIAWISAAHLLCS